MIISTKKGTPKVELEKIVDKFEKQGLDVTLITGKDYNVFGLVGDTTKIDERDVLANPWIDNVTRVQKYLSYILMQNSKKRKRKCIFFMHFLFFTSLPRTFPDPDTCSYCSSIFPDAAGS